MGFDHSNQDDTRIDDSRRTCKALEIAHAINQIQCHLFKQMSREEVFPALTLGRLDGQSNALAGRCMLQ